MSKRRTKEQRNPRSGSVSVLLMILLASLITVFLFLYDSATFQTLEQAVLWNGENAGQAVLSYYIPELKDRYDLYGVWNESSVLECRMNTYVKGSSPFWRKERGSSLLSAECQEISADPSGYLLMDLKVVKHQMERVMEHGAVVDLIQSMGLIDRLKTILDFAGDGLELKDRSKTISIQRSGQRELPKSSETIQEDSTDPDPEMLLKQKWEELERESRTKENEGEKAMELIGIEDGRSLEDTEIIERLPTRQERDPSEESLWDLLRKDPGRIGEVIHSSILTDLYALHYFGNYIERQNGWFVCQLEYILQGELSDEENLEQTKRDLFFLRTILNVASIYRDDQLRQTIGTMATAAAPVPYSAAFGILAAAFSAAEAGDDVRVLMTGGEIPALKNAGQWASVIGGELSSGTKNDIGSGEDGWDLSYRDHLHLLLLLRPSDKKVLRMMDLIQLDLQDSLGNSFTLNDLCGGFQWKIRSVLRNSMGRERGWTCEGVSRYGT